MSDSLRDEIVAQNPNLNLTEQCITLIEALIRTGSLEDIAIAIEATLCQHHKLTLIAMLAIPGGAHDDMCPEKHVDFQTAHPSIFPSKEKH